MTTVQVCVFCRKHPIDDRWRPFCSERCKLLDLAAWAEGTYHIPAEPIDPAPQSDATDDVDRE